MSHDTERTPLVPSASTPLARDAIDIESHADAAPSVEYVDDADDLTPLSSHKHWPRKRGLSAALFAVIALAFAATMLYVVEPSSSRANASAAATPASANADTARETAAAEASGIATTPTESTPTAEARTVNEATRTTTSGEGAGALSWDAVVAPQTEEVRETIAGGKASADGADASGDSASGATDGTSSATGADEEKVQVSLATRHSFSNAEFAVGVVEACSTHKTAVACTAKKDVYGCAWLDGMCRVGCGVFESKVGCATQGELCSYDVDGGGCSYTPSDCHAFNAAVACTTAGSNKCGWLKDRCFDRNAVMQGCISRDEATCAVTNPADFEEIPCMWHTPKTLTIDGAVVYIGDEENFENTNRTGLCITELPCAQHTSPDSCATQTPMCVYDYSLSACVHAATVQDSHRLCSTASDALNTCPDASNGAKLFCNFNFEHSGYCQRCSTMSTVDDCLQLVDETGQERCVAKCFTSGDI